jgi:hypothetical protein
MGEVLAAAERVKQALAPMPRLNRKGTPMPHSYKWADAEHTVVQRDDGCSFDWPKGFLLS